MRITIVSVGKRMPPWVTAGVQEYLKRFPPELSIGLIEVAPERRSKGAVTGKIVAREAQRIKKAIPEHSFCIALDETGKQHHTKMLAERLNGWSRDGLDVSFIIGGADGLDPSIINQAGETWSLSNYTMPHPLVRVFLIEQLYRAWTILSNHPYHRD